MHHNKRHLHIVVLLLCVLLTLTLCPNLICTTAHAAESQTAYFYMEENGAWTPIGSLPFSLTRDGRNYVPTIRNDEITSLLSTASDEPTPLSLTSITYARSESAASWSPATVGSTHTTFGSSRKESDAKAPLYIRVSFVTDIAITYDINFPSVTGVTATAATVDGSCTASATISAGESMTVKDVSARKILGRVSKNAYGLSRVIYFKGWQISGTDTVLQPGETLTWDTISTNISGGKVQLNGLWAYDARETVSFYIRYDSVAVDTSGNVTGQDPNQYTNELFASYVFNATALSVSGNQSAYGIEDLTADNSFTADRNIRALEGAGGNSVWLLDFPDDEAVFEQLRNNYDGYLYIDGEAVSASELGSDTHAIRWYVFKCQDDAWHVDGKLVRKSGCIEVSKTFAGDAAAISSAKESFYIEVNSSKGTAPSLTLNDYTSHDPATDTYTWLVPNIDYGVSWTFTEKNYTAHGYSVETFHSFTDPVSGTSDSGPGDSATVTGMVYAEDTTAGEMPTVRFTNTYHAPRTLRIQKVDAVTSLPLSGAGFEIWTGQTQLTFSYDNVTGAYIYDTAGTAEVFVDEAGQLLLSFLGLPDDYEQFTIRETTIPAGRAACDDTEVVCALDSTLTLLSGLDAELDNNTLVIRNMLLEDLTALPDTGGFGTGLLCIAGLTLMLSSLYLLFVCRKRQH